MTTQSTAPQTAWHTLPVADALEAQGVDEAVGLSSAEVEARRAKFGANKFAEAEKESGWSKFVRQYQRPDAARALGRRDHQPHRHSAIEGRRSCSSG